MKLYKYDFKLLNNDKGIIEYKDKTPLEMVNIINKHLQDKFGATSDLHISIHTIYNLLNGKNTSKYLKIFIKEITKKQVSKSGDVLAIQEFS